MQKLIKKNKTEIIIQLTQDPSCSWMLDWTMWPLQETQQEYNRLQDFIESVERTAWLELWGHEGGDPGKHTFCTAWPKACQFFFASLLYCFIDNKLSVVTVPDRPDSTWLNTINREDNRCGRMIEEMKEAIKRVGHRRWELNTACECVCLHVSVISGWALISDEQCNVRCSLTKSLRWQPHQLTGTTGYCLMPCFV